MLPSRWELADGSWVQISACKTRTLQPDGEGVHNTRWNEWLLERKFTRQVRAPVHVHERVRWERDRDRERLVILPLSAAKLRLSHRCVAERTTIPPSSTRFTAYTATSAYIIPKPGSRTRVHGSVAQHDPERSSRIPRLRPERHKTKTTTTTKKSERTSFTSRCGVSAV